ncbi:MAG: DUF4339 domain-containing protein [Chitinophagaceae bacterium]|nr:DUF4339 domain-containing protein [Chitinophagaceae bacterium]
MRQYFIHDGENEKGPFDVEQLKLENIQSDTMVWYEGLESWSKVKDLPELKDLITIKPPPLKAVAPPPLTSKKEIPVNNKKWIIYVISGIVILTVIIALVYNNDRIQEEANIKATEANQLSAQIEEQKQKEEQQREEEQQKEAAIGAMKLDTRTNWQSYFKYSGSDYTVAALGGISNLKITFTNNSKYNLDEFSVAVNYILANGSLHATDIVTAFNLKPGETKTIDAPGASRGTSVKLNIQKIVGTQFNFYMEKSYFSGKQNDQYFKP